MVLQAPKEFRVMLGVLAQRVLQVCKALPDQQVQQAFRATLVMLDLRAHKAYRVFKAIRVKLV